MTVLTLLVQMVICLGLVCADTALGEDPPRLRVLSYNIQHGRGSDGQLDLKRIAGVIQSVSPDIVALQEVDRGVRRSDAVDQPSELAKLTGMQVVFGGNLKFQGGDYGNAVLTRLPILEHKNHRLPSILGGEQRGLLEVRLEVPGSAEAIRFLCTHLDHRPNDLERMQSAEAVNQLVLKNRDVPAVLAGDLNATPDSRVLQAFAEHWQVAGAGKELPTYPVEKPQRQIDYILYRPADRWQVIEVRVLDDAVASDHRAIFAVLELVNKD
jgi:endonuclease/exonuclease/phosphatase family metal-dependent hydrolase